MTKIIRIQRDGTQLAAYVDLANAATAIADLLSAMTTGELLISISEQLSPVVQDLSGLYIGMDTGHGGADPGAVDGINQAEGDELHTVEKVVNFQIGEALIKELTDRGARVLDIRASGGTMSLTERSDAANAAGVDMVISLHANAAGNPAARGFEVFYYSGLTPDSIDAQVATAIDAEVSKIITVSRGVKAENLHMLRETRMPAVLLEAAFVTNPEDEKLLNDPAWITRYVKAIADGVAKSMEVLSHGDA